MLRANLVDDDNHLIILSTCDRFSENMYDAQP